MRALRLAGVFLLFAVSSFAQYRIAVWIPTWDPNGLASLQLNAGKMSESNPVWYQLNSGATIAKLSNVSEDPTWRAAMAGTQILPTLENIVNGSYNATVAASVINSANRDAHAENIRQLVVNQAYDGIDIDYENLSQSSRADFTAFITTLASKLHASGKTLSVTLYAKTSDSPTWDGPAAEDYAAIGQQADWVKLMCYDYSWDTSAPGPIAPLSWIDQVVTYAQSVIPSQKIIVGLPWYGYDWGSTGTGVTYQQAMNTAVANGVTVGYDANGEATYKYGTHTVYFQDANSYNKKADLIVQKHPTVGGFAHWRIAAEDPNIWTRIAALKGSVIPPAPPSAPASLGATTMSASVINLAWTDTTTNQDGVRVERCAGAGCTSFATVAQLAASATSYGDSGLTAATSYTYRVIAYNSGGTSAYSNSASATTQTPPPVTNGPTLISAGSIWKYLDNGSDQATAWSSLAFDDSWWKSGPAQLGYGDGDEATVVGYGPDANNKYITTYFRRGFDIADASQYTALKLRLVRDDGAVVYLNGKEVTRPNMPTGTILYNTLSAIGVTGTDESTFFEYAVDPTLLVSGHNVLAVEIHQFDPTSSDISFDAELTGTLATAPPPAPPAAPTSLGAAVMTANQINLTWTDNATNEDGYRVERCSGIACTAFAQIGQLAPNATAYFDTAVAASTSYSYRVIAFNSGGTSAYSNIASATTLAPPPVVGPQSLIVRGATWKYLDNGSNQGSAWTSATYDDSLWKTGPAELGYGDGDEATVVGYGPDPNNKYITTYFRTTFNVADPTVFHSMTVHLVRDDGAVVYLNGQEIVRSNMPGGTIGYQTLAATTTPDETTWFEFAVDPHTLVAGKNVIAVEIHQADVASSDISFNLDLIASDSTAPTSLAATVLSRSSIALSWTNNASNAPAFSIERCTGQTCTNFALVATTAANATSFTDNGLARSTYYRYRVAVSGTAQYSNVVTAKTTK